MYIHNNLHTHIQNTDVRFLVVVRLCNGSRTNLK